MTREDSVGELPPELQSVKDRLEQIKKGHRGRIRWHITEHTAEMAIAALRRAEKRLPRHPSPKSRRRKRHKRLL